MKGRPSARRRAARPPGVGRLVTALALAVLVAAALAAPARAGTFRVSQCNTAGDGPPVPRAFQADLWWVDAGWRSVDCGRAGGMVRVHTPNFRLPENGSVSTFLTVPPDMPGTSMRTAWLDWRFSPQAPSEDPAYLDVFAGGAIVLGARPGDAALSRLELPAGSRELRAEVWCSPVNGPGWCRWPGPLLDVRGVTLELEEDGVPDGAASGALLERGTYAGVEPVELDASDDDSGVASIAVSVAGVAFGTLRPPGGCRDDRLPPCPQSLQGTLDVDTRAVADGSRRLRLVVTDAAGNVRTIDAGTVEVRNQRAPVIPPPPVAPSPAAPPPPSPAVAPPAAPQFPANPLAGRGHVANGTNASERARIAAWLEPSARRRTRTTTVPWGVRVRIRGTLTDQRGRPIGRATIAAIRREDHGPWKAVTGVRTRANGRFTAFARIGPSQRIQFVYYAFGDSAAGRRSPVLHVRVRRE